MHQKLKNPKDEISQLSYISLIHFNIVYRLYSCVTTHFLSKNDLNSSFELTILCKLFYSGYIYFEGGEIVLDENRLLPLGY